MKSLISKNDQKDKIYQPYKFPKNPLTHLGVIAPEMSFLLGFGYYLEKYRR